MPIDYEKKHGRMYFHEAFFLDEKKTLLAYSFFLFIFPLLPLSQLIIGTIVNAMLVRAAISARTNKVLALAFIPSIAAAAGGVLFGSLTGGMLLMLPFIWAGNATIMILMRKFFAEQKKGQFRSAFVSSAAKTFILFASAGTLFMLGAVPEVFLTAFGVMQLATALMGTGIALFLGRQFLAGRFASAIKNK